jgi:7,8-dihydro-6-hydroxymethylpterin-pyrophosphokinase
MIEQACREMDARGIRVKRTSSLWETDPMYVLDQAKFVNGACEVCLVNQITQDLRAQLRLIGRDGP